MRAKGEITGGDQMIRTILKIAERFPDRVAAAIYQEAQIEMTEAKRRTPVDITPNAPHPGQLRASGHVQRPERQGRHISVVLAFGTDYAIYVHENPDAFHPVGQWKFLESVLNESESSMEGRIARRIHFDTMRL